ncbi:T9SS type A sorting domain-containing protein [candidate division KSB1 bacterium]|nr:T9SS type A sorting domain-containing protein [candidate division KSB1 bacterium]
MLIFCIFFSIIIAASNVTARQGIWTSAEELAGKPMEGPAWEAVLSAANNASPNAASVSDQDSNNNAEILAAGIVYARTGESKYRDKVVVACEKLANAGKPDDRTLAWARETGAYAMAADLVGYKTSEFELWLRNMAENYVATDDRTLLGMFKKRPNNWGTQGFGSLCAIYAFLQDTVRLNEVRNYWIQSVVGPKPDELTYGDDLSWHVDTNNLRLINPKGAVKQGLNIDGIIPDDMRRGTSFKNPPEHTGYAWETLQGIVMGARILERCGMPIWAVADSAIYRAFYAIQVRWENQFGGWKAEGDDLWMLPFLDAAYGTNWSDGQPERVWEHGKNTGWPYVICNNNTDIKETGGTLTPDIFDLKQNYPNPFNPTTCISYTLSGSCHVKLTVFDIQGQMISVLVDQNQNPGDYNFFWQARSLTGQNLPTGFYFCRLQAGHFSDTIKTILMK